MAERSELKNKLKYHRIVVLTIGLSYIWFQYEYSSGHWSYENGQPKIEGTRLNGKDEGQWTWFYENGKKRMQGSFVGGQRTGLWTIWDTNGTKLSESMYDQDKLNGAFVRMYSNGKPESTGVYKDDQLIEITRYNINGSIQ